MMKLPHWATQLKLTKSKFCETDGVYLWYRRFMLIFFLICSEFDGYHMMLQKPRGFYVHGFFI